jgi:hypothetical protein
MVFRPVFRPDITPAPAAACAAPAAARLPAGGVESAAISSQDRPTMTHGSPYAQQPLQPAVSSSPRQSFHTCLALSESTLVQHQAEESMGGLREVTGIVYLSGQHRGPTVAFGSGGRSKHSCRLPSAAPPSAWRGRTGFSQRAPRTSPPRKREGGPAGNLAWRRRAADSSFPSSRAGCRLPRGMRKLPSASNQCANRRSDRVMTGPDAGATN